MKTKLISSLKKAINALENNSTNYKWTKHASCNCGVVLQSILGKSRLELEEEVKQIRFTVDGNSPTWREMIQEYCPITGIPTKQIFKDLLGLGISPEDLTHLEYLDNPVILKESGIKTFTTKKEQVKTGEIREVVPVTITTKKLFRTITKVENMESVKEIFEDRYVEVKDKDYHRKKENLILYLKAWVRILEEQENRTPEGKENIQKEILKCVSNENLERDAELRDKLATL